MQNRKLMYIVGILFIIFSTINVEENVKAKNIKVEGPQNVIVTRYKNRALKIQWKKEKNVDGYKIYKYSNKKKKFIAVKTINHKKQNSWIDKGLKIHKVYKYKVASFTVKKGKKIMSKRSYTVSARTYGKRGKIVNAEDIDIEYNSSLKINICGNVELYAILDTDEYSQNKKARPVSKKVTWISDNNKLVKINKNGKVTSSDKEGICNIYCRAHNGVTRKVKVQVINYARPKSFPYYSGNISRVNDLLMNYRNEVYNIATYFTKNAGKGSEGVIQADENGKIIGLPQWIDISTITTDVDKLITEFPCVVKIYYSDSGVIFKTQSDVYGNAYTELTYFIDYDCEDSSLKIAPHWTAKSFASEPDLEITENL